MDFNELLELDINDVPQTDTALFDQVVSNVEKIKQQERKETELKSRPKKDKGLTLSKYQQNIIETFKNTNQNLFIEALAGSGKTFILVELSKFVSSYSVFIAFNKSIQEELQNRITNPKFKTYTFNGLGYSIMRYNWQKQENEKKKQDASYRPRDMVLQNNKIKNIVSEIFKKEKVLDGDSEEWKAIAFEDTIQLYNLCRQRLVDFNNIDEIDEVIDFYNLYEANEYFIVPPNISKILLSILEKDIKLFQSEGIIDFTDQIFITYFFLKQGSWSLEYFHRFNNLFIDEAQDLSKLQQLFVGMLRRSANSRYVFVGDKYQSIYSFAGADCHSTDSIKRIYKTLNLELPINYRCPYSHLDFVNEKYDIPIQARDNAPKGDIFRIKHDQLTKYIKKGDCVLSRINKSLCEVALILLDNNLPIYIRDESLVNNIIKKITNLKKEAKDLEELLVCVNKMIEDIEKANNEEKEKEGGKKQNKSIDVLECVTVLLKKYISEHKKKPALLKDFDLFISYIRERLCTELTPESIQLTSIHQAKGKEYERVFILNNNRIFNELGHTPDQRQQEKNLVYIAMTRSKDTIFLVAKKPNDEKYNNEHDGYCEDYEDEDYDGYESYDYGDDDDDM